jgi:hypothetical protein
LTFSALQATPEKTMTVKQDEPAAERSAIRRPSTVDKDFVNEYRRQLALIAASKGTLQTVESLQEITETRGWV